SGLRGFAVLINVQNQSTDQALQGEGNGRFHDYKRRITATNAATAEVFGNPDPVNHQAYGETTGVSGSPWTDRLRNVIEDGVRAIKNLPAIVGHRPAPPRRLAPPGVYFTLRYFSVHSPHGVRGILPGTKVVRVRDVGPSMLRVSAGETEFDAKAQDLTNDL